MVVDLHSQSIGNGRRGTPEAYLCLHVRRPHGSPPVDYTVLRSVHHVSDRNLTNAL